MRYELTCGYCGETFVSKRTRGKYCSHEHYVLGAQKGKPRSAEWRAKIGEANRRRVQSAETRAKISAAKSGTTLSPEHRAKISAGVRASQIKIEPDLTGDRESSAETTLPATLF